MSVLTYRAGWVLKNPTKRQQTQPKKPNNTKFKKLHTELSKNYIAMSKDILKSCHSGKAFFSVVDLCCHYSAQKYGLVLCEWSRDVSMSLLVCWTNEVSTAALTGTFKYFPKGKAIIHTQAAAIIINSFLCNEIVEKLALATSPAALEGSRAGWGAESSGTGTTEA